MGFSVEKPLFFKETVDSVSYVDEEDEMAVPAASKISVGSEGASDCVIALLRIRTKQDVYMGSSHWSSLDMKSMKTVALAVRMLYSTVIRLKKKDETIISTELFAVGGEETDDADHLQSYENIRTCFARFKGIHHIKTIIPASKLGEYVDVYMDRTKIKYQVEKGCLIQSS